MTYEPFGLVVSGGNDRFLYTGKELDSTGIQYFGARYYCVAESQFCQPDQLLPDPYNPQALNRYSYTLNNPYKYTDPDGNSPTLILGAGLAAAFVIGGVVYQYATYGEIVDTNSLVALGVGGFLAGTTLDTPLLRISAGPSCMRI